MTSKQYDKLAINDLAYVYPSTQTAEDKIGVVQDIILAASGGEPHIIIKLLNGQIAGYDYSKVGALCIPRKSKSGTASVKIIFDQKIFRNTNGQSEKPSPGQDHFFPNIEQVAGSLEASNDQRYVLVQDPWANRLHWLTKGSEYTFVVTEDGQDRTIKIALESIPEDL